MSWFYVRDHLIEGPIAEAEFNHRVQQGEIGLETLVWREGSANWTPWGTFPKDVPGEWTPNQLDRPNLTTPVGTLWTEAWDWFQREPWPLLGFVTLGLLFMGVAWVLTSVFSLLIPVIGSIAGLLVLGPLQTGVLFMLLERRRGRELSLKSAFRAFGPRYPQLLIGQAVQSAVLLAVGLPTLVGVVAMIALAFGLQQDPDLMPVWLSLTILLTASVVSLVGVCLYFYLAIAWLYAPLLILDKGLDFWPAMQLSRRVANRHPWSFSWFLFVASTLALMGLLLLGVGVLFTTTLCLLMLVLGYERQYAGLRA